MARDGRRRIAAEIPEMVHDKLKTISKERNITMTRLIMKICMEYIRRWETK